MLKKFEVTGVHMTIDDKLRKYISKKLGQLDKYIAKHDRASAHMLVRLKQSKQDGRIQYTCEVTLKLPKSNIVLTETTVNPYAAVDIVQTKLKNQIKKSKDIHQGSVRRRLLRRFRHANA